MTLLLVPDHIAIIMDGNGRWARERGLPRYAGHRKGIEVFSEIVVIATEIGVKNLTIFAFSIDNWRRPNSEITQIVKLINSFINKGFDVLKKNNVKVRVIGNRLSLDDDILLLLKEIEEKTQFNTGLKLFIAFNYSSRDEISRAFKGILKDIESGFLCSHDVSSSLIARYLDTSDIPDPDLIIRTGGEKRLSDFLLWQAAYSEFVFIPEYWPDFSRELFLYAVDQYALRDRRFGGLSKKEMDVI
ncbi:UDP pyrophosphate synthase [Candidatus Liberibacter solanacearum]|uniref:Isoprenyl transferase n=1 Tax=Candidatus Liberibacter solanacearum TaxID=556287 RepID=A0A094Z2S2_9HYPH|nr:polyprenyl diphosphate synthase [Candidatus Liberibacter solanacearum]KGB27957.1 UDP pyrophosphate synthase [Candidatus Liberibacter solanacearum]KJZ80953.1 UDP pyrophosphate synthase [Candidatus Liberibacter solanacearum]KJZ82117.1 Undecaprenyl pyrophosphate synthetase [Candidatus Liberibacter solanacearum]KQC49472.1 UDP pyrophosphate synthase [Candidatus Liberibacter solanacearum]